MFDKIRWTTFVGIPAAAAFLVLTACGGSANASQGGQDQLSGPSLNQSVTVHYKIVAPDDPLAKKGSDGNTHDTFWALDSTTVHVGDVVTIDVSNYDDMPHGMTFPELGLSKEIPAGTDAGPTVTTFTFTASKAGTFRWFCPIPCDTDTAGWAMKPTALGPDQDGYMAGSLTVVQ